MSEINCFVDVNKGKLSFMLSMDSEVTWKMFNEEMSKYLNDFDLTRAPRFSYEDEDGDRVFFESDLELKEALSYAANQELFIILVDAAEKEALQPIPSVPSAIPSAIPQEAPQQNAFEDLSDVVNVIGKALQKDLPQIANVIENVLGDKEALQNNLNCAAKFISQFCEEEKDDIEKLVEEFLPGLVKVPKQKKVKKVKKVVKKAAKKPKVVHHAICDYCSKHIEGIRYKCLQCPDYDLCEACEAVNCKNKFHDEEHVFAKIMKPLRSPVVPNPHFAARMMRGGQCPGQQRFERVRNLEDKVQHLESELAQIKALLLNNNNNQAPVEEQQPIPVAIIPEVSSTEQQQQVEVPQPVVEQQPEPVADDLLTEEERQCFEQLKAMGFDVHSSIVAENNADLSLILEKLL